MLSTRLPQSTESSTPWVTGSVAKQASAGPDSEKRKRAPENPSGSLGWRVKLAADRLIFVQAEAGLGSEPQLRAVAGCDPRVTGPLSVSGLLSVEVGFDGVAASISNQPLDRRPGRTDPGLRLRGSPLERVPPLGPALSGRD
jgi:hypothetical protein